MIDTVIVGGITGLSFGEFYFFRRIIIEQDSDLGGYCTTIRDGFIWDRADIFSFQKSASEKLFYQVLGKDYLNVSKNTIIYYQDTFIDFSFQSNIHQLEKSEYIDCLIDMFEAENNEEVPKDFKDFILKRFGISISEKFLIPIMKNYMPVIYRI